MSTLSLAAYVFSVLALTGKYLAAILVQGRHRLRARRFRYPEDAACWEGEVALEEAEPVRRAERLLRNDAESQPLFLALGAAYVALGLWPPGAVLYFGTYVAARLAHAWFLLRPRQPHRNRAFSVAVVALLALGAHVVTGALLRLAP